MESDGAVVKNIGEIKDSNGSNLSTNNENKSSVIPSKSESSLNGKHIELSDRTKKVDGAKCKTKSVGVQSNETIQQPNIELLEQNNAKDGEQKNGDSITDDSDKVKITIEVSSVEGEKEITDDLKSKSSYAAFTRCQESTSGTDDSQSDSSDSDSESSLAQSETSSSEDEDQEPPVRRPIKPRNTNVDKETVERQNKKKKGGLGLYKGELDIEDLPPIEELHITVPQEDCEPLGTVCSIVNQLVVVQSMENKPALNLDSLLFKKDGESVGQIFDVFGPVKTPFYTLRFNSREEIASKGLQVGQTLYCAPQTKHTKYVFVYQLMKQKGSDASWKHNYEVPDSLADYSDDEEEKRAKRKHHQKTRDRPYRQGNDHETSRKIRPNVDSKFVQDYNRFAGNEWYKARVSELNQFQRFNQNQPQYNNNFQQQQNFRGNNQGLNQPASFPLPPPSLLRPQTPNNWNRLAPNGDAPNAPYGQSNQIGGFRPPTSPYHPPNLNNPPYFPNNMSAPRSFNNPPPPFSYEKLNGAARFTNPVTRYPNVLSPPPHPLQRFIQPSQVPVVRDNNQQNVFTRPNTSFNTAPSGLPSHSAPPGLPREPPNRYFNQRPSHF